MTLTGSEAQTRYPSPTGQTNVCAHTQFSSDSLGFKKVRVCLDFNSELLRSFPGNVSSRTPSPRCHPQAGWLSIQANSVRMRSVENDPRVTSLEAVGHGLSQQSSSSPVGGASSSYSTYIRGPRRSHSEAGIRNKTTSEVSWSYLSN